MEDKDTNVVSALRFHDYMVEELVFKRNSDVSSVDVELHLSFEAQVSISPEKDKAFITLTCEIFDDTFEENTAPFFIKITLRGFFDCKDVTIEKFQVNGMAILLPYLRATISSVTAQAGIKPVIIPPINVFNVFKIQEQQNS